MYVTKKRTFCRTSHLQNKYSSDIDKKNIVLIQKCYIHCQMHHRISFFNYVQHSDIIIQRDIKEVLVLIPFIFNRKNK